MSQMPAESRARSARTGPRARGTSLDELPRRSRNRRTGGKMRRSAHHGDVHAESTRIRAEPRHRDGRHSFTARNTGGGCGRCAAKRDAPRRHSRRCDPDRQQRESERSDGFRHRRREDGSARRPSLRRRRVVEAHRVDLHRTRRPRRANHAVGRLGRSAARGGARLHGKRPLARHRLAELRAAGAPRPAGKGAGARGAPDRRPEARSGRHAGQGGRQRPRLHLQPEQPDVDHRPLGRRQSG